MSIPSPHISEVLPDDFDRSGMHSRGYWEFEKRAIAFLKTQGWKFPASGITVRGNYSWPVSGHFVTTDGDSFGPMVRVLFNAVQPDGTIVDLVHG